MPTTTVEKEVLGLEEQYWRAIRDKDVEAAKRLTDFPCLVTGPRGVGQIDEGTFTKKMQSPACTIRRVELGDDAQVRLLRDDVAVIAYKVHEELVVDGKPVALDAADSSTWIRRNGRWACAHHSGSIVGDPFGRDRASSASPAAAPVAEDPTARDERAIRDLIATWMSATRAHDWSRVLGLMADDVVFHVPGRPPFGKQEFAASTRDMNDVRIEPQAEVLEVGVHGDGAWCRTHLVVTMAPPDGQTTRRSGYTLTVLRRKPDGAWVVARDANLLASE